MIEGIVILIGGVVIGFYIGRSVGEARGAYVVKHGMLEDITECLGVEAATTFVTYTIGKRG